MVLENISLIISITVGIFSIATFVAGVISWKAWKEVATARKEEIEALKVRAASQDIKIEGLKRENEELRAKVSLLEGRPDMSSVLDAVNTISTTIGSVVAVIDQRHEELIANSRAWHDAQIHALDLVVEKLEKLNVVEK
jgi:hypothetical protein